MNVTQVVLATLTGFTVGALFKFVEIPIPAPPNPVVVSVVTVK